MAIMMSSCKEEHIHAFGEWTVTKVATCTEAGAQERVCSCGEKQTQAIAATGHSFGNWVVTKVATCTETGEQERICACGEKQTQAIAMKEHDFTAVKITNAASCTEEGEQEYTCSCGKKQIQKLPKIDHHYESKTTKAATCESNGVTTYTCSMCKDTYTKTINATGHKYAAATCTAPKKCSICGKTEGSALGHNFNNGVCSNCGLKPQADITLPTTGGTYWCYTTSQCQLAAISITKHYYSNWSNDDDVTVSLTAKSTFHKNGNNYSTTPVIGYKLYDSNNVVVKSGSFYFKNVSVGESSTITQTFYDLTPPPGKTYKLVLLDIG